MKLINNIATAVVIIGLITIAWMMDKLDDKNKSEWENMKTTVVGQARVIDGDTIIINGHRLRLLNIDAPEINQDCLRDKEIWPCGQHSKQYLANHVKGKLVNCWTEGYDIYNRLLANCYIDKEKTDINRMMVHSGWAIEAGYKNSADRLYQQEERFAQLTLLGIHAGQFENPALWRKRNKNF